jgi:uncharacterized membrane protein YbhN (UPF0104 family)
MTRSAQGVARLAFFLALWLVLVAAGAAWAVRASGVSAADVRRLATLPASTILILGLLFVGLYAADVYRYRLLGEAAGVRVGLRAALDASVANYFFGWLTPGGAFGAPGAIVVLARRGVPWDAAVVIAFAKSITGTVFLLLLAFLALAAGLGPDFSPEIRWVLATGSGVVALMMAVPMVAAFFPRRSVAWIDRLEERLGGRAAGEGGSWRTRAVAATARGLRQAVERLAQLRAGGVATAARLAWGHLAFFAAFIGVAAVLARALGAGSWPRAVGVSTVYLAFSYLAPTPGGAGLSEAAAVHFFGAILPPPEAVVVGLLARALTFYLQIAVGAVYLPITGVLGEILASKTSS